MLNCVVCGHDNFPFTSSRISSHIFGLSSGHSLKMVSQCHQCGARVSEKCVVCDRLHPLGSVFCSVEGIDIGKFKDGLVNAGARIDAFMKTDRFSEIMDSKSFYSWILVPLNVLIAIFLGAQYVIPMIESSNPLSLLISVSYCLICLIQHSVFSNVYNERIKNLWRDLGNKEPLYCAQQSYGREVRKGQFFIYQSDFIDSFREKTEVQ